MSKIVAFNEAEIAEPDDFTAIGEFARQSDDALSAGALGWPAHWARITVAFSTTPDEVIVGPGEFHSDSKIYSLFAETPINLQSYKPLIATDERWLALVLRGSEGIEMAARPFETGEEPLQESVPVNQSTPKYLTRAVSVVIQQGPISPAPALRPTIAEADCCIAFVRLTTTGVAEIVANEADRVKTAFEIEGRLEFLEVRVNSLSQETEAIATDLASVASKVKSLPSKALLSQITRDMSKVRRELQFPDEARNYFFDQGLVKDFWDMEHISSIMRVREGVRFQYAMQRDAQLRLLNTDDPAITFFGNKVLLPKFEEKVRIESAKGNGRQDLANTVHTVRTAHRRTRSRTVIRYGETVTPCENTAGWENISSRRPGEIFSVGGREYVSEGKTDDPWNQTETAQNGHSQYAARRVIRDRITSSYTYYTTEEFGLSGATYGQTFLNSQLMVCTSIDIYLTRVGSEGDIIMSICEINSAGAPDFDAAIATVTLAQSELRVNAWNKFIFEPTLLEPGKRYAWFVVTTGNHQAAMNAGNTFTGGTKFVCTDGIWSQGSTTEDFSFRLHAAKFDRSRTIVQMESLQLENGMTEIEMSFEGWEPDGCSIVWEVKAEGTDEWAVMDTRENNPLRNMPPLVQLRAVLIGTEDVAPSLVIDQYARVLTGRMRPDLQAISQPLDLELPTDTFQMHLTMDAFDPDHQVVEPLLMVGGAVVEPDQVTPRQDPDKPSRWTFVADWILDAPASEVRVRVDGATDDVILQPFVQDIQLNAF